MLETRWWGPPPDAAPKLVLLQEGLGCVALWRDFPEALADAARCGVFAYSRVGYGASDPATLPRPIRYMHDEATDVLPRVLDVAGVRKAVLLGPSDGASIAAIFAGELRVPRVAGVVMIAVHVFVEDLATIRAISETYEHGDLRARLARYHRDVDVAFHGWSGAWLDPRFRAFDITGQFGRIRIPALALRGTDDPYGSAEQLRAPKRAATCSVQTQLIAGARHAPHLETRQETMAAIVPFVHSVLMEKAA